MKRSVLCLGLFLVVVGLYANSMPGSFHYDDYPLFLENPDVAGPDFRYSMFLENYGGRALTLWSFHLNWRLAGDNPLSYHLTSVLLHGVVVVLLFLLLSRELASRWIALGAAVLFAVHPLQTHAVNYIWSRSVLLMAVFVLGSLLAARRRPWLALLLFQLAIWSRAEALAAAPLLWILQSRIRPAVAVLSALNLAAVMVGLVRYNPPEVAWNHQGWFSYLMKAPAVFWAYVGRMAWPSELAVFHGEMQIGAFQIALAAVLLAAVAMAAVALRERFRAESWGFLWIALFLAPSLLVPNTDSLNEGRSYLALAGFAVMVAAVVSRLATRSPAAVGRIRLRRGIVCGVGLLVVVGLVQASWQRNEVWQDDVALWREAVQLSPAANLPRYNLGVALARQGEIDGAVEAFTESVRLNPKDDMGYAGLGYCAESRGLWQQAIDLYSQALSLNPGNSYAREAFERSQVNLGAR